MKADDAADALRFACERCAEPLTGEVIDRAPEIHVHQVGAARRHQFGGPRHFVRLVAGQLHAEEPLVRRPPANRA